MSNAFHWRGAPSIFTTNAKQHLFGEDRARKNLATSLRKKNAPVSLTGGSIYNEPELVVKSRKFVDSLLKGAESGRRKQT